MPYINDEVFDSGLDYLTTNGDRIDICYTQEPTTYTEATSTYTCGNETTITVGAAENGDTDGRKVVISQITAGDVTATETAGWWALSYVSGTALLAANALSSTQAVTSGNTFTLGVPSGVDITFRDPS